MPHQLSTLAEHDLVPGYALVLWIVPAWPASLLGLRCVYEPSTPTVADRRWRSEISTDSGRSWLPASREVFPSVAAMAEHDDRALEYLGAQLAVLSPDLGPMLEGDNRCQFLPLVFMDFRVALYTQHARLIDHIRIATQAIAGVGRLLDDQLTLGTIVGQEQAAMNGPRQDIILEDILAPERHLHRATAG